MKFIRYGLLICVVLSAAACASTRSAEARAEQERLDSRHDAAQDRFDRAKRQSEKR